MGMNLNKLQEIVKDRGAWHAAVNPDTSQIHGSSPESTLEPCWTPLEHSTVSSREPKPILVSTPILENQTYNNKTHFACFPHLN